MTAMCPAGHVSTSPERCDVCGEQIADRVEPAPAPAPSPRPLPRLASGPLAMRPPTLRPAMLVPPEPGARARRRIRLGLGLVLVATALAVGVGTMLRNGNDDVRRYIELERHGAQADVQITRIAHRGLVHSTVCGSYVRALPMLPPGREVCVSADTRGYRSITPGSRITVRYQRDDPTSAIVVGANPGLVLVEAGVAVTPVLAVVGVVLLASSRRAAAGLGTGEVVWVGWTGLLGLTSWLSIWWAARETGRWSLIPAAVAYGVGAAAGVWVLAAAIDDGRPASVGVVVWLATWIASIVHAFLLVPTVARARALTSERS